MPTPITTPAPDATSEPTAAAKRYRYARGLLAEAVNTTPDQSVVIERLTTFYKVALTDYALTPEGEADLRRRAHYATVTGDNPHRQPGEPFRELATDLLAAANKAALWHHRHPTAA